jgi:hypothetical protein
MAALCQNLHARRLWFPGSPPAPRKDAAGNNPNGPACSACRRVTRVRPGSTSAVSWYSGTIARSQPRTSRPPSFRATTSRVR